MDNSIEYLKKYLPEEQYEEGLIKLKEGIPVQYIVGNVNFYGNKINVNKYTLIPRFETEELVHMTIDYIDEYFNKPINIVDLGTGSGCIAITIKKQLPESQVDAVDISKKALEIAKLNSTENNVDINFYEGNMMEPLTDKYDCIISNPPYIDKGEEVMSIVKNNEPELALYASNNGLYFYDLILKQSLNKLSEKNLIAFEIGHKQAKEIKKIVYNYYPNAIVKIKKDMQNRDRFVYVFNE